MRLKKTFKNVSLLLIGALFLTGCSNQTKSLVLSGTIEATEVDVNAEISGKIIKILKDEGSSIAIGDPIAVVDSATAALQVESAEAALKAANAKLDELKAGSREEEIKQAEAAAEAAKASLDELSAGSRSEQIAQAEATYLEAQEGVTTTQKNYDYRKQNLKEFQELLEYEAIAEQEAEDAQNIADAAYQQLVNAKTRLQIAKEQLSLVKKGATHEAIRAAEANYKQALAKLQLLKNGATKQAVVQADANVEQLQAALSTAKLQLSKYTIKSEVQGILLYKSVEPGQFVSPGTVVGTIQTNDPYWIKVYLPQKHNGKVTLNQKVRIKVSALKADEIQGTVIFKSPRAEFTPKNIETTEAKEENTVVAVKIQMDSHRSELSPGMTANVYID
ncbi:MAG: secretion protein HlyD family protein [Clostridia bacterium]|jgi:HlyD family secretion protein|nr:secretion protein HlyD family protein [Clostridia bacterium]